MKNIFLISFLSILAVDAFGQSASDLVNNPGSNPPSTNGQAPNNPPVTTYPPVTTPNSEVETQANINRTSRPNTTGLDKSQTNCGYLCSQLQPWATYQSCHPSLYDNDHQLS